MDDDFENPYERLQKLYELRPAPPPVNLWRYRDAKECFATMRGRRGKTVIAPRLRIKSAKSLVKMLSQGHLGVVASAIDVAALRIGTQAENPEIRSASVHLAEEIARRVDGKLEMPAPAAGTPASPIAWDALRRLESLRDRMSESAALDQEVPIKMTAFLDHSPLPPPRAAAARPRPGAAKAAKYLIN